MFCFVRHSNENPCCCSFFMDVLTPVLHQKNLALKSSAKILEVFLDCLMDFSFCIDLDFFCDNLGSFHFVCDRCRPLFMVSVVQSSRATGRFYFAIFAKLSLVSITFQIRVVLSCLFQLVRTTARFCRHFSAFLLAS